MLGSELAGSVKGLRRWVYSSFGILDVDERIWYWHYRRFFFATLRTLSPARILDAGCGDGLWSFYLAREFPQHQIVGVDIRQDAIDFCNQLKREYSIPNLQFQALQFTEFEFDQEFDLILSFFSLHYSYKTDVDVLAGFARALKPGGSLFLTVPVAPALWQSPSNDQTLELGKTNKYGVNIDFEEFKDHYRLEELSKKLNAAGFLSLEIHRLVGRLGQLSKSMYSAASGRTIAKIAVWPFAIILGWLDSFFSTPNGMIWLVKGKRVFHDKKF